MKRRGLIPALLAGTLAVPGCDDVPPANDPPPAAPVAPGSPPATAGSARVSRADLVRIRLGNEEFALETAVSAQQQRDGLMFRQSLPDDGGMIFVFPNEAPRSFWMKNTYIPLDLIYLDAQGRVTQISALRPGDLTSVVSEKPAQFAIELNAGAAARAGVQVGQRVDLPAWLGSRKER